MDESILPQNFNFNVIYSFKCSTSKINKEEIYLKEIANVIYIYNYKNKLFLNMVKKRLAKIINNNKPKKNQMC